MAGDDSFKKIEPVLLWVLLLNWGVSAIKILLGLFTKSAGIMADGFHSFSDGLSNIVGIVGIRLASRPKDRDHPYGHKKMENFTAVGISMTMLLLCIELIESSVRRLLNPVNIRIDAGSFIIMGATVVVNYFVTRYEHNKGRELKSDVLIADSFHTKSDIYVSITVMAGMLGVAIGFLVLDVVISLIVAVLIAKMAVDVLRSTSKVLCDGAMIEPELIRQAAMAVKGVRECHEIRTRGREDEILVDLRVHVDDSMHVNDAHDISGAIEDSIKKRFPGVAEVTVHIEPASHK